MVGDGDTPPTWDEYDYPYPSFVERFYGCASEGECLVTMGTPPDGSGGSLSVCAVDSRVDPKIQAHAKLIRDNAAKYLGMKYWNQLTHPDNSRGVIDNMLEGGTGRWWEHLPRLCHCRVSPSLHCPVACYNSRADPLHTLYSMHFYDQMRDSSFLRRTCEGSPTPSDASVCSKQCFQPDQIAKVRTELEKKAKKQRSVVTEQDVLDSATCRCRKCYAVIESQMSAVLVPAVISTLKAEQVALPNQHGALLSHRDTDQLLAMVFAHQFRREVRSRAKELISDVKESERARTVASTYLDELQIRDRDLYAPTYHHITAFIDLGHGKDLGDYVEPELEPEGLFMPCPYLGEGVGHAVHECLLLMEVTLDAEHAQSIEQQ